MSEEQRSLLWRQQCARCGQRTLVVRQRNKQGCLHQTGMTKTPQSATYSTVLTNLLIYSLTLDPQRLNIWDSPPIKKRRRWEVKCVKGRWGCPALLWILFKGFELVVCSRSRCAFSPRLSVALRTTQLLTLSDHTPAAHRAGLGQAIPGADWAQAIFRLQTAAGLGLMVLLKADEILICVYCGWHVCKSVSNVSISNKYSISWSTES